MHGFGLLMGHLFGDYILQNDWMAANKAAPGRGGLLACATHCTLYTLAVWCMCPWLPLWALAVCGCAHFPLDRWRLARLWMNHAGQPYFAEKLGPWSVIVVDNTFHLAVLYWLGLSAGG